MRIRLGRMIAAFVTLAVATLFSITLASAQRGAATPAPAPAAPAARGQTTPPRGQAAPAVPRMPDGKPNLSGLWQALSTANWDLQDHPARPGPYYQMGALLATPAGQGVVDGNEIPYKPELLAKRKENFDNRWTLDPEIKCFMPGIPRATYMPFPFQIVQGTDKIAFAYEFATSNRVVQVKNHMKPAVPSWMGTSNGSWEGDTLIIVANGFNEDTWFDRSGNFHSDALKVTERYKFRTPDVIDYEATIEDPKVFTRPWKISLPLYRRMEKNAHMLEFKCVEYVEELIYGHLRKQ